MQTKELLDRIKKMRDYYQSRKDENKKYEVKSANYKEYVRLVEELNTMELGIKTFQDINLDLISYYKSRMDFLEGYLIM